MGFGPGGAIPQFLVLVLPSKGHLGVCGIYPEIGCGGEVPICTEKNGLVAICCAHLWFNLTQTRPMGLPYILTPSQPPQLIGSPMAVPNRSCLGVSVYIMVPMAYGEHSVPEPWGSW